MAPLPNSQELFRRYREGDDSAATAIFDRYVSRLLALARSRLGKAVQRRLDPDDVVQSAYLSFFHRAKAGRFQLEQAGDLWRLLAGITLNKLRGQLERQSAAKRDPSREDASAEEIQRLPSEPTVAEVIGIAEELNLSLAGCTQDQRFVLLSHLQGEDAETIASHLGRSQRTVRRLLDEAKQLIEQRLLAPPPTPLPKLDLEIATLRHDDYRLEQLLGSGAVGKVYRATQISTGETVAIKAIQKRHQQDRMAVAKFVQEADILSKLSHPMVVALHGVGQFPGGGLFLVLNYVDGSDLQTLIDQSQVDGRPLSLAKVLKIARTTAEVLAYLHQQGVLHGDLKPANVLLSKAGHLYIADFGFALLPSEASANLLVGGTFGFVAPEVLEFKTQPTEASDIYAFGIFLQRLLTASSESQAVDRRKLESVAGRCTEKMAEDRFANAAELLSSLG